MAGGCLNFMVAETIQYDTIQYNTIQYNTIMQYNTIIDARVEDKLPQHESPSLYQILTYIK